MRAGVVCGFTAVAVDGVGVGVADAIVEGLTLPGTLEGLLRRCSPGLARVVDHTGPDRGWTVVACVVGRVCGDYAAIAYEVDGVMVQEDEVPIDMIALDLDSATGRAHAVWWVQPRWDRDMLLLTDEEHEQMDEFLANVADLDPLDRGDDIARFRGLCLKLAGEGVSGG